MNFYELKNQEQTIAINFTLRVLLLTFISYFLKCKTQIFQQVTTNPNYSEYDVFVANSVTMFNTNYL